MKQMFLIAVLSAGMLYAHAQTIQGTVVEQQTGQPLSNVTITVNHQSHLSGENGSFSIKLPDGLHKMEVSAINFSSKIVEVQSPSAHLQVELERIPLLLQPIEINTVRASVNAPFAKSNLSKRQIEKLNLGQDLPFVLNQLPGVVASSDAGNGVGYTAMRIRGTDGTRINITLNGIPYNDAESQGSFFVNLPDFTSSVSSIQVQRGVGTSTNGAGAFGATINMSTNEFIEKPYAESNNSYGSFNTWKNTVKAGTGLLDGKFTVDARLSSITSDGYINRATSNLQSIYLSAAYFANKSSVRFNFISGKERTYHAWNGIDEATLKVNRRFNSAGTEKPGEPYENETDNYQQDHFQLFYNQEINTRWNLNTTLFLSKGKGYYEQYKANRRLSEFGLQDWVLGDTTINRSDVVRQLHLDNQYFGGLASAQYKNKGTEWITGGGWNRYEGDHFGKLVWGAAGVPKDHQWYNLDASKTDLNFYSKLEQAIHQYWSVFADVQYRRVVYNMNGFRDNPQLISHNTFNFVNPKAGISYKRNSFNGYFSYAMANKEPNRDDFEAGATQRPIHETLHDLELGFEQKKSTFNWSANLYYMAYRNQLVLTGKINDVGAYARTNIPNSYRAGIELQAGWRPTNWFNASTNIALSKNKIKDYTVFYDDYDVGGQKSETYSSTDISFSPAVTGGAFLNFLPVKNWELSLLGKYVGKQYLDNTQNEGRKLNAFFVQDIRSIYTIKPGFLREVNLVAQVNNVFNKKYEPNGYTFSYYAGGQLVSENFYFPMAGTNFMLAVNIKL